MTDLLVTFVLYPADKNKRASFIQMGLIIDCDIHTKSREGEVIA